MNKRTQSIRAINKLFIVTAALLLIAMTSGAQTYWKGGTGDWTIGANWSAGLPTGTTDALITNGTVQVSPGMTATARALDCRFATVNQTGGALTLTAGASKYLLLQTNSTYNLSGGSLVVSNIVMLGNSGTNAVFNLSGSGSLTTVGTGVQIGINAGNEGLLTQAGTSSMTQNNNFIVGNSGVGVYVLSGGSATVNIGTIYLGNFTGSSGTVLQSGGTLSAGSNLIIGRNANTKGVYRLSGGTLQCSGIMYLNYAAGSTGVVSQTGGDVAVNSLCVARTAYGYYELAGGTLESSGTANTLIGYGNNLGLLYMTGGTNRILNGQYLVLNYTGAGTNVYYASGGSLVMSSFSNIELGYGGTPTRNTFTLAGNAKALGANLVLGRAAGGVNIANLNGGVLTVNGVGKRGAPGGLSLVNFDGGTLQASADGTLLGNRWGPMLDAVSVYSKGATFDSSNLSVTNDASLLAPPGDGVVNIPLTAGGGGYIGAPYVSVEGGGGTGATAVALIDRVAGSVTGLVVTSRGYGYTSVPTVALAGGGGSGAALGTPVLSANISGGLTKLGSGTLTLSGTNTYTGVTSVSNGVLRLAHALALSSATALTLAADTSVDLAFTGTNVIYSLTVDGDLKQAGVYGASRLYGRLTGTGYLMTTYGPAKGTMIRFF